MRPLNTPGAAPTVVDYRGASYWAAVGEKAAPVLAPVILEPIGERIKWITDTPCGAAKAFRDKALGAGWWSGMSYSRILDVPPSSGQYAGRWVGKEFVAVRVRRGGAVGFGMWCCAEGGSWAWTEGGMLRDGRVRCGLKFEDLEAIILDVPPEELAERKRERALRRAERKLEKILKEALGGEGKP